MEPQTYRIPSRSGGEDHFVRSQVSRRPGLAGPAGTTYLTCSCPAGRFTFAKRKGHVIGRGCWAMQTVRQALGLPAI